MQLAYRGTAYEKPASMIEITETQQEGLFLGSRFKIKQFNLAQRHSQPTQLKYQGIVYNN